MPRHRKQDIANSSHLPFPKIPGKSPILNLCHPHKKEFVFEYYFSVCSGVFVFYRLGRTSLLQEKLGSIR